MRDFTRQEKKKGCGVNVLLEILNISYFFIAKLLNRYKQS